MNKRRIAVLLLLCMIVALFPGMALSAGAVDAEGDAAMLEQEALQQAAVQADEAVAEAAAQLEAAEAAEDTAPVEKWDFKAVFKANLYVAENKAAGLQGDVTVAFKTAGIGTLYLPGAADASQLFFSWDDPNLSVTANGVSYASGTAPVALPGQSVTYQVQKGSVVALVTVKTVQGSSGVQAMFLKIDESLGTIDAMNSDETHETVCYGGLNFDGTDYYISMKGRGNSTWGFDKKPYNVTFYKKADFAKKQKVNLVGDTSAKKWSLLANYLDNSLMRNKIGMDLASDLGIGLDAAYVDVWMNGEYLGNYTITPKNDYAAPDGGYALENDNYLEDEDPQFEIPGMFEIGEILHDDGFYNRITVKDIGDDAADAGVDAASIEAYFTEAWYALEDFGTENYQNYFDMDSWAKMFLMYEVTKTYDCFSGSLLMHRDGLTEADKLIAGPMWDMDNTFGRTLHKFLAGVTIPNQMTAEGWYNDAIGLIAMDEPVALLQELGKHESFMKHVAEIYNEYKWAFERIVPNIEEQAAMLKASADMNNVLWGVNHIGTYYSVAPAIMNALGTGKYKLNYELTLTWENYIHNMKEFCTKRVMWLSDHLYAETPAGSITEKLVGDDIILTAALVSGDKANTYQWQSSPDGKVWTDLAGETGATLKLTNGEDYNGMQFRCVVKNDGVDIYTTHGGWIKASAKATLEPIAISVESAVKETQVVLQNGTMNLLLNGRDMGEFTFKKTSNGMWSIRNADGKYLTVNGEKLVLSKTAYAWSFENGVFGIETRVAATTLGKLLGIGTKPATAYLTVSGGNLTVSTSRGAQATFVVQTEYLVDAA